MPRALWRLFAHPLLMGQLAKIGAAGDTACRDLPAEKNEAAARLLIALRVMMTEIIPADPLRAEYRPAAIPAGWRRAEFAAGRFSIFYRADAATRSILFGWISDAASDRGGGLARASGQPMVLFGRFCTVSDDGRIRLPKLACEGTGLTAGARLDVRFDGATLCIEAAAQIGSMDPLLAAAAACLEPVAVGWPAALQGSKSHGLCPWTPLEAGAPDLHRTENHKRV